MHGHRTRLHPQLQVPLWSQIAYHAALLASASASFGSKCDLFKRYVLREVSPLLLLGKELQPAGRECE